MKKGCGNSYGVDVYATDYAGRSLAVKFAKKGGNDRTLVCLFRPGVQAHVPTKRHGKWLPMKDRPIQDATENQGWDPNRTVDSV